MNKKTPTNPPNLSDISVQTPITCSLNSQSFLDLTSHPPNLTNWKPLLRSEQTYKSFFFVPLPLGNYVNCMCRFPSFHTREHDITTFKNQTIITFQYKIELTCSAVGALESSHASTVVRVYSIGARSSILARTWSTIVNV